MQGQRGRRGRAWAAPGDVLGDKGWPEPGLGLRAPPRWQVPSLLIQPPHLPA